MYNYYSVSEQPIEQICSICPQIECFGYAYENSN